MTDLFSTIPDNIKTQFVECTTEGIELMKRMAEAATTKGKKTKVFKFQQEYPEEVTKYFVQYLLTSIQPISYPRFLYDMAVTHTIAMLESFLSDFLTTIFRLRPNTLKSENTATYEEILSFSSREELISHLANSRAEKLLKGDLRLNVADNLNKTFYIDISQFDRFNIIHEAFCRRHIIVHNDGFTDKEYCKKIPESQTGEELSTDLQYIETLLTTVGQFIDYLDSHFSRKMHYRRSPFQNKLLNPPDFKAE